MDWSIPGMVLRSFLGVWPVALGWLAIVIALGALSARKGWLTRGQIAWAPLPFAFTAAIILCGVVFANPEGRESRTVTVVSALILVLLLAQVAVSIVLAVRMRNGRVFSSVVSAGAFVASLFASFISGMSVSGDWL